MDEKKVKCRECGKRATRYEGMLPTRGVAPVLLGGIAVYIAGIWVLSALAAGAAGDPSEAAMMDLLIVVAAVVTVATAVLVFWMFRPKRGAVVACPHCGARYTASKVPSYSKGWDYDKIVPAPSLEEGLPDAGEGGRNSGDGDAPALGEADGRNAGKKDVRATEKTDGRGGEVDGGDGAS